MIHVWLQKEASSGIDTFLCNWNLTQEKQREGDLLVYVDLKSGEPVAYQWGDLTNPGILEVRMDMRRKGIGEKLVKRRILEAYEADECLLMIECTPTTSIPFWKKMGFTLIGKNNDAYRILPKPHVLPSKGKPVRVSVRFFTQWRLGDKTVKPAFVFAPKAVRTDDNTIHLDERVYAFPDLKPDFGDTVVEIRVNGKCLFLDKAKRPSAREIGIRRCSNGWFMDRIFASAAH